MKSALKSFKVIAVAIFLTVGCPAGAFFDKEKSLQKFFSRIQAESSFDGKYELTFSRNLKVSFVEYQEIDQFKYHITFLPEQAGQAAMTLKRIDLKTGASEVLGEWTEAHVEARVANTYFDGENGPRWTTDLTVFTPGGVKGLEGNDRFKVDMGEIRIHTDKKHPYLVFIWPEIEPGVQGQRTGMPVKFSANPARLKNALEYMAARGGDGPYEEKSERGLIKMCSRIY